VAAKEAVAPLLQSADWPENIRNICITFATLRDWLTYIRTNALNAFEIPASHIIAQLSTALLTLIVLGRTFRLTSQRDLRKATALTNSN